MTDQEYVERADEDITKCKALTNRERMVLRMRFGFGRFNGSMTLQTIGDKFEITRERVRKIEAEALRKLRIKGA